MLSDLSLYKMPTMLPLGSHLSSLRAKAMTHIYIWDTHLYACDEAANLLHMKMIFPKFAVIIQVTKENWILYTNNFQMKNHIKTHRNLTKITKEFYQTKCWQILICLYKYNKGFYADFMMINENKIKLVTGAAGAYFTILHIPPKCLCTTFMRKWSITKYENKWPAK